MMSSLASAMALRMGSPPGTSPRPMLPELSVSSTTLRVNQGAWAPLRLSNMLSCPATGMTCTLVMTGVFLLWAGLDALFMMLLERDGGRPAWWLRRPGCCSFLSHPGFPCKHASHAARFPGAGLRPRGARSQQRQVSRQHPAKGFPAMQQRLFQLRLAMGGRREFRVESAPRQIMELCQHLGRPWMLLSGQGQGFVAEYRYHATSRTRQRELERIEAGL